MSDTLSGVPLLTSLTNLAEPAIPRMSDLAPPPRFHHAHFRTYIPQDPTQQQAVTALTTRVAQWQAPPRRWPWQRKTPNALRPGLYLDGGFGVGKTHLLAATWHAATDVPRSYTSFQELLYFVGTLGMAGATEAFHSTKLLLIDEFELDDPGNTLLVKRFLEAFFAHGGRVVTTSNTEPTALGAGRFNAEDFQREIQGVASLFDLTRIDGPDYRQRTETANWLHEHERAQLERSDVQAGVTVRLSLTQLLRELEQWHPARYGGLAIQLQALHITDVHTIASQNDALRFVHFIDKIYDHDVHVRATGSAPLHKLFHDSYHRSAYLKKHLRCQSRLAELLVQARAALPARQTA